MKNFQGRLEPARRKTKYTSDWSYKATGIIKEIDLGYETNKKQ